ncbi:MAG: YkgJ family cysteine cluster protein [Methanobacteriota archaeon]
MDSPCLRHGCTECCKNTEMLLSNEDIERLARAGFHRSYFAREINGWLELKNVNGRCAFNDGGKCLVYEDRPEGCRSYPVVHVGGHAVLDGDCPHKAEFEIMPGDEESLLALVAKLKSERRKTK